MPTYDEDITLKNGGKQRIRLSHSGGDVYLGGSGAAGELFLFPVQAPENTTDVVEATAHFHGGNANLRMGGSGQDGDICLFGETAKVNDDTEKARILLNAGRGNIAAGGNGKDGDFLLFPETASCSTTDGTEATLWLDGGRGNIGVGGNGNDGDIVVFPKDATCDPGSAREATIHIDGDAGDIVFQNADCAEEFDTVDPTAEPGTVVVLDGDGGVESSTRAYDSKIAGVVSGAGGYKPGMVLDKKWGGNRVPIALMGKVGCKADATESPIEVGDLLTSSDRPGYAMKAADSTRAFGAVIGKALGPLESGQGVVPVLVNLQ